MAGTGQVASGSMTQRSRRNAAIGLANSSMVATSSRADRGCRKRPRRFNRSQPVIAQRRIPGNSGRRRSKSAVSSWP